MAQRKALGFHDFLRRAKVIRLYRDMLRTASKLDHGEFLDVKHQIRAEFEKHRHEDDAGTLKGLLVEGAHKLAALKQSVTAAKAEVVAEEDAEYSPKDMAWPWKVDTNEFEEEMER
ncbi:unnamed protein product, partial [Symbiodinium sp. KB8]